MTTNDSDRVPIPCAWKPHLLVRRKVLTDRTIAKYEREGWYDRQRQFLAELGQIRKKRQERKAKTVQRDGNFLIMDGRLIYSPK